MKFDSNTDSLKCKSFQSWVNFVKCIRASNGFKTDDSIGFEQNKELPANSVE